MALPTNLSTNEVKFASGTGAVFNRIGPLTTNPRSIAFEWASAVPARPFRISFQHKEEGEGRYRVRRSVQKTTMMPDGTYLIDSTIPVLFTIATTVTIPIGNLSAYTAFADAYAAHESLQVSRGANTTILYDGTGYGMEALKYGTT